MIDTEVHDPALRMYTTAQMIEELGLKEARFYELREKHHLFQEKGMRDGRNVVFGQEMIDRYKQQLQDFTAQNASPTKEENVSTSIQEEPLPVRMITLRQEEIPQEIRPLDPIEQAIAMLQVSKQQGFERQQMIEDVRTMCAQLHSLQQAMDDFLERYQ